MTITVYQNHFSVERGCETFRYDSVDGDRLDCECAFLYLPGLMCVTWPNCKSLWIKASAKRPKWKQKRKMRALMASGWRRSSLLGVQFVQRAVHANSDAQVLQAAVTAHLVHHGGQAGAAELGSPPGHHAAHLLHQDAVVTRGAGQAQVLQDGAHLPQGQPVTGPTASQRAGGRERRGREGNRETMRGCTSP